MTSVFLTETSAHNFADDYMLIVFGNIISALINTWENDSN